jgi:hypothetical protein
LEKPVLRIPTLTQGLLIVTAGIGSLVLLCAVSMALIPILVGVGFLGFWLVALVLVGWGGIEVMAALERWLERDSRFQR